MGIMSVHKLVLLLTGRLADADRGRVAESVYKAVMADMEPDVRWCG
jgi:hypothetical protein